MNPRAALVERMLSYPLAPGVEKEIKSGRMYRFIDWPSAARSRIPTLEEVLPFFSERANLLAASGAMLEIFFGRPNNDPVDPLGLVGYIGFKVRA